MKLTGEQAVAGAHAHERGYRDYMSKGLTARNPFDAVRNQREHERWAEGFTKAEKKHRPT
jgi:hypothetical protein